MCAEPYTAHKARKDVWQRRTPGPFSAELLDALLEGRDPKSALDSGGLIGDLKKALAERMLNAEMDVHLDAEADTGNHRNGTSGKTVLTDDGSVDLEVPRDREGTFEPQLIPKHARRFTGFDDKIRALYARRPRVREIQAFLAARKRTSGVAPAINSPSSMASASPARRLNAQAPGRWRACGRTERNHTALGNPPSTRFPTDRMNRLAPSVRW